MSPLETARQAEAAPHAACIPGSSVTGRLLDRAKSSVADGSLFFGIALAAIWLLSRPFEGIEQDARIYLMRVLADLDPAGMGQDMMFAHDGQSQFSVFSFIARGLVAVFGIANTSLVFAFTSVVYWLFAALFFVGRFAEGRIKWAILMIAAVVPSFYGPLNIFRFAEQYAVPRPLAEACTLVALAFLIERRRALALIWLALAAILHPIMALPGAAVYFLDLCGSDRRWIAAGAGAVVIGIGAAFAGVPVFDRLIVLIDTDWLSVLRHRNLYLFPTLWPVETFGVFVLQSATVAVAAQLLKPDARFVFLAAVAVGAAGLLIATIFGDLWPFLLISQMQFWRSAWLVGALAAIGLGLCLVKARHCEPRIELAIACMALGWLSYDIVELSVSVCLLGLLFICLPQRFFSDSRATLNAIWILVLVIGIVIKFWLLLAFLHFFMQVPEGGFPSFLRFWNIFLLSLPIAGFAILWARYPRNMAAKSAGVFAAVAILALICFWDDRSPIRKMMDSSNHPADLMALIPADRSEVYWLGDQAPEQLTGHPGWAQSVQGGGMIFSRELAMLWRERTESLLSLQMADELLLDPWTQRSADVPQLQANFVDQLCARKDAPSTIVAPIEEGMPVPAGLKFKIWKPPVPYFRIAQNNAVVNWHRIEKFIIVSCADHAPDHRAALN